MHRQSQSFHCPPFHTLPVIMQHYDGNSVKVRINRKRGAIKIQPPNQTEFTQTVDQTPKPLDKQPFDAPIRPRGRKKSKSQ